MKSTLFIFVIIIAMPCIGQELHKVYRLRTGDLSATVNSQKEIIEFGTKQVISVIDNETGEITVRIKPDEISSTVDSIHDKLKASLYPEILFEGNLNVDYLNIKGHVDQVMEIDGNLTIGDVTEYVQMQGILKHWPSGPDIQCMLYIHFDLELQQFGLDKLLPEAAGDIACIEILQPILDDINGN